MGTTRYRRRASPLLRAANDTAAEFVRRKIRATVEDPEVAELLCPDYLIACKRPVLDSGYFETFSRSNVRLVDIKSNPIESITPVGVQLVDGSEVELDVIVFATGFDGMTGALLAIDIVKTDVTKEGDAANMVKQAVGVYGKLDILFNNAGILGPTAKLQEVAEEDIDRLLAVNLKGAVLGTKHAVPAMIASGGGSILSTGSDSAFRGNRNAAVYCATKGAIVAFTRAIAMDYVGNGIRCNSVSPCIGETPMHAKWRERDADNWNDFVSRETPMGRACDVADLAKAALFLVSDDASFITGENLMVDGGTMVRGY